MRFQTLVLPVMAILGSTLATPVAEPVASTNSKSFALAVTTLFAEARAEAKAHPGGCGPICTAVTCLQSLYDPGNAQKTCATTGLTPSEASTINMLQVKAKAEIATNAAGKASGAAFNPIQVIGEILVCLLVIITDPTAARNYGCNPLAYPD